MSDKYVMLSVITRAQMSPPVEWGVFSAWHFRPMPFPSSHASYASRNRTHVCRMINHQAMAALWINKITVKSVTLMWQDNKHYFPMSIFTDITNILMTRQGAHVMKHLMQIFRTNFEISTAELKNCVKYAIRTFQQLQHSAETTVTDSY